MVQDLTVVLEVKRVATLEGRWFGEADSGDPEMVHALIWVVTMQTSFGDNSSAYT